MAERDPFLTERVRAAGITAEDEAYAWKAFNAHDAATFSGRLRIRAVASLPTEGGLQRPTVEEMVEVGLTEPEAREYVENWDYGEALESLDSSLFMAAACIAGARALDAWERLKAVVE